MDRYTAAALGQNLTNAFSDIGQIFDPRARAAADQQRLAVEGLRLKNTGVIIENQYAPRRFESEIAARLAAAGADNKRGDLYGEQTSGVRIENTAKGQRLRDAYSIVPLPSYEEGVSIDDTPGVLPPKPSSLTPEQEARRQILLMSVDAPGDLYDAAKANASIRAQFANAPQVMDQGLAGQGTQPWNASYQNDLVIADRKNLSEQATAAGNAQLKLIGDLYGGSSTRRGDGSMLGLPKTAPNSFSDARKVDELAQDASFRVFGVPVDDEGAPTEDPFAPSRRAWSQSFSNAMSAGMTPIEAEAAANVHHFGTDQPEINSENTFRFGFGKDPSLPTMKNTEPLQASPEFGVDQERTAALIASIPELFGLPPVQPQQGNPNVGTPVTGVAPGSTQEAVPPMLQRPAEQPAKVNKLSDQFKRREGSTERKVREAKEKEIAALEAEIKDTIDILKTGQVNVPAGLMNGGMMSGAFTPPSGPVTLSDDGYNRNLDRLKEMEAKLEKLKGGGVQAGQNSGGAQTIGRYNPATGAIE